MKKNSFMQGAVFSTVAIILTKVIGILYVIPFYKIIGDQGGALYGYAYTIYSTFLSISTVGIPLAISKVVSEYNALGYTHARERVYKQGKRAIMIFALVIFLASYKFIFSINSEVSFASMSLGSYILLFIVNNTITHYEFRAFERVNNP